MPTTETPAPGSPATFNAKDMVETPPEPSPHVRTTTEKLAAGVQGATPAAAPPAAPPAAPMPAPTPAASVPPPVLPPRVDQKGNVFDAERHLPKIHPRSGVWMPKKPSRDAVSSVGSARVRKAPGLSTVAPDEGAASADEGDAAAVDMPADKFQIAALGACTTLYAAGMTVGGDEWQPTADEHANLMNTTETYFRAKGITDLSPGWALTIAVIAYAGPRFRQPKTLSSLQKIGGFFRRVVAWWKARAVAHRIPGA